MILFKGKYVCVERLEEMVMQGDFMPQDIADALREAHGEMFILMFNVYSAKIKGWHAKFTDEHGTCKLDADSFVYEVWFKVVASVNRGSFWKGIRKTGHKDAGFKTWLHRVAENAFGELLRSQSRTVKTVDLTRSDEDEEQVSNDTALEDWGRLDRPWFMSNVPHHYDHWGHLMKLEKESKISKREVEAFIARRIHQVPAEDYARDTGQAVSTVNLQAERCAKKLRDMMGKN